MVSTGPLVSIILVNYNGTALLRSCLSSIYKCTHDLPYEIIVVDNHSSDASIPTIRSEFRDVCLIENAENIGYGAGSNLGARQAKGKYLLFLNTDTVLSENSIRMMANYMDSHPDVGALGPKLRYEDGCFQLSAGQLPNLFVEAVDKLRYGLARTWRTAFCPVLERWYTKSEPVGWLTGACLLVSKEAFLQVGGFDEHFFMYYEDKDLCLRLQKHAWKVIFHPATSVMHLLGGSSHAQTRDSINHFYRTSQLYYYQKHLGRFQTWSLRLYLKASGKL